MITCVMEYTFDAAKVEAFERFGRDWIALVNKHGGTHHGYFLPSQGASDRALALFSFPSLADYEFYRALFGTDPDFAAADQIRDESGCLLRYERSFMRPVLTSTAPDCLSYAPRADRSRGDGAPSQRGTAGSAG